MCEKPGSVRGGLIGDDDGCDLRLAERVGRARGERDNYRFGRFDRCILRRGYNDGRARRGHRQYDGARECGVVTAGGRSAAHGVIHGDGFDATRADNRNDARVQRVLGEFIRCSANGNDARRGECAGDKREVRLTAEPVAVSALRIETELDFLPIIHAVAIAVLIIYRDSVKFCVSTRGEGLLEVASRAIEEARRIGPVRGVVNVGAALHLVAFADDRGPAYLNVAAGERKVGHLYDVRRRKWIGARRCCVGVCLAVAVRVRRCSEGVPIELHPPHIAHAVAVEVDHCASRCDE